MKELYKKGSSKNLEIEKIKVLQEPFRTTFWS